MEWLNAIRCYRPYSEPEKAARWLIEIANADEAIDGRIQIGKINAPFLYETEAARSNIWLGSSWPLNTTVMAA
jgi:hypothetical protein